jgi:hypothetical protein
MDNNYKIDKLAIIEQNQQVALEGFREIEDFCKLSNISFLKENFKLRKIRDRKTDLNFKFSMAVLWSKVCALSGIKLDIDQFIAEDISRMIINLYSDLTIEEIYKAFELERHGAFESKTEHFQLFNAEYVSAVLKKYKQWKQFTKIQHNIGPENNSEQQHTITIEEQFKIMNNAIIRIYDEFIESGEVSIPCNHVFDELYSRKIFPPNTEYQKKYAIAKFQLEKELKAEKITNRQDRLKIQEVLSNLDSANNEKVLSRAKQLVLKDYFTYLKSINTNIRELISD